MLDNLPALRDRLAEQEIRIEKFDVDVQDEGRQQQENLGAEDRRSNDSQSQQRMDREHTSVEEAETDLAPLTSTTPTNPTSDSLDVMI